MALYTTIKTRGASPLIDPAARNIIGEMITEITDGRFENCQEIGRGGECIIFSATDQERDRRVAIKVLRPLLSDSRSCVNRFFLEAIALCKTIHHPQIIRGYDYYIGGVDRLNFFTLELLESSVREWLESPGGHPTAGRVAKSIAWGRQTCWALGALHSVGIVHRDVKPDNLLLTVTGETRLTDLGIACFDTTVTCYGFVGTPRYASPEQCRCESPTPRSDIYGLGIVLYEMVVGDPPFTVGDIADSHIKTVPQSLGTLIEGVPDGLSQLVNHCLAKDPQDRPDTDAVEQELKAIGQQLSPPTPS